jgi:hypothetical protein
MSETPQPSSRPEANQTDPAEQTEATIAALGRRLAELDRERQRVRPEDWTTLFRQMRVLLEQLAAHPFLRGDAEAEARLTRMMRASDLEAFDRGVDHLADYVAGKLAFNAAIRGKAVDPSALHPTSSVQTRATGMAARASAQHGPSGDDFAIGDAAAPEPDPSRPESPQPKPPRRSMLRL